MNVIVPIEIALSDSEVDAANTCGVSAAEYARRKIVLLSEGRLDYDHRMAILHPTRVSNQFEVREISI
jgi:hypothetical protein